MNKKTVVKIKEIKKKPAGILSKVTRKKIAGAKKIGEPKKASGKILGTLLSKPKLRSEKSQLNGRINRRTSSPVNSKPPLFLRAESKKKTIGYFVAGSLVMTFGLLLATQNEVREESSANFASAVSPTLTENKYHSAAAPDSLPVPVPNAESARVINSELAPVPSPVARDENSAIVPSVKSIARNNAPVARSAPLSPLSEEFLLASSLNSSERIKFWSSYIESGRGHREKVADLAAGFSIDDVAAIIPKKYDCTTYIETVAALSQSNTPDQFIAHLLAIRYKDGTAVFSARNHLPDADWIPNNQRAGILKDITGLVAQAHGLRLEISRKSIDRNKWLASRAKLEGVSRSLASTREDVAGIPVQAQVPYIRLSQFKGVLEGIPDGAVINLVHGADNQHNGLITHQAFFIKEGGKYFLRHASKHGFIRSSELISYLNKLKNQNSRWPVVGINLNQLSDSSSSTSRLSETM